VLLSSLARSSREGDLLVSPIEAILDVSTTSAGSEDSKMNAILDISAIPVSSSPSLLNREPTMLNAGLSCEWRWNPDTQEILDAGGTSWAENTPSPMKIIIPHGEYDSEPLAPPTMRKPGAAVSPLSPARTLSTYTVLPAPPPIELQYLEGDVDAASARYVSLADLTGTPPFPNTSQGGTEVEDAKSRGSGTHSESESEFDADDSGEFVPGRSNSKRRRVKQELTEADGPLKRLRGRGRAKAANHRNTGSAADALRVITELSSVRTSTNGPLKAASETPNLPYGRAAYEREQFSVALPSSETAAFPPAARTPTPRTTSDYIPFPVPMPSATYYRLSSKTLPLPVPVPHLIKTSRGRRVPALHPITCI
jgi:hypothetical protein